MASYGPVTPNADTFTAVLLVLQTKYLRDVSSTTPSCNAVVVPAATVYADKIYPPAACAPVVVEVLSVTV